MEYWNQEGKHYKLMEKIHKKYIDGTKKDSEFDKKETTLIKDYVNYIYDLYNNGLCNIDVLGDYFKNMVEISNELLNLSPNAQKHINNLKELFEELENNSELSDSIDIDYEEDYEEMSEKEEHTEYIIIPIMDKLQKDYNGVSELGDAIMEHIIKHNIYPEFEEKETIPSKDIIIR